MFSTNPPAKSAPTKQIIPSKIKRMPATSSMMLHVLFVMANGMIPFTDKTIATADMITIGKHNAGPIPNTGK